MPDIYDLAERFRRQQLRKERAAASEMVRAYGTIWQDTKRRINELTRRYYDALQADATIKGSWLYQFERLQTLRAQVEAQLADYARYAATTIQAQQWEALQAGSEHGYELMQEAAQGTASAQGVDVVFNRLPANAINYAIGFQQDGSPLVDVLNRYGQDAAKGLGDALIQGLALGQNPSVIARFARERFGVALWEALRLARTETLRAYRSATLETYRANSDVVAGWVWMSARNERTCAACWAMDGTFHKLDERLDDHPNGRCFAIPRVKGMELPARGTGVEAFGKLSNVQQLKILGPAKYAAFKDGTIKLKNLIGVKQSEKWGRMFYERSLKDVIGPEKARKYYQIARVAVSPDSERLRAMAEKLLPELDRELGMKSYWSGKLEVENLSSAYGVKHWNCSIGIDRSAIQAGGNTERSVLLHEMLHSYSIGAGDKAAYAANRGLEEGVVEKMQRILHRQVFDRMGVQSTPGTWAYNRYVDALEDIRRLAGREEREFYQTLIGTKLADRKDWLLTLLQTGDVESIIKSGVFQ